MIQVRPDMTAAKAYLQRLERRDLPRVIGRSLDRTRNSVRSAFSRRLRERLALKKVVVDESIKTRRSGEIASLTALAHGRAWFELRMSGAPIPLRDFGARVTKRGVTYQVSKTRGRRRYVALGQLAFVIPRFGNHVFVRKDADPKAGIRKVFGPALKHYLLSKREQRLIIEAAGEFWAREVERNAKFALSKRGTL